MEPVYTCVSVMNRQTHIPIPTYAEIWRVRQTERERGRERERDKETTRDREERGSEKTLNPKTLDPYTLNPKHPGYGLSFGGLTDFAKKPRP